ncbi:P2R1A-PPP2R2A-interacting phosphatase regulator 1 isoform X1 [Hypomesus transpacificus]|uniref:P2R1A-PPP2R2A-interacting phosphatase regulator 1 isoform X1 n=2 Tax=Hypomesus transpacificus TaxID=137520 RepID=UPI001F0779F5|nr:P2R1A-PPP2R2A-interacting phosphatase regulator 1 isoform X1 [Hypomesus transpacificus]
MFEDSAGFEGDSAANLNELRGPLPTLLSRGPRIIEMERMEVDQCAGAAAGSGALRRSNSAPMITSVSDGMTVFSPTSSARYRRSSVSVNPSCPSGATPLSPFSLGSERPDLKRQENMEMTLRGSLQRLSASNLTHLPPVSHWHNHAGGFHLQDSGVTPNSSPSPTRRFRPQSSTVRWPALTPLKRKGGVESDGPPKKLFIAGVTDPTHSTSYTVSVSQASDSPSGGVSVCATTQESPLALSPPPSFTPHHPGI